MNLFTKLKLQLWQKVTLGLILGIIFGITVPSYAALIKPIGDIFLRALKMIIGPVIFFALISGVTSMADASNIGKVGLKATLAYLITTCFAVIFGLVIAFILKPGIGVNIDFGQHDRNIDTPSFDLIKFLVNIVPSNVCASFVEFNLLQIVFFSIFTGIVLIKMGSYATPIVNFFNLSSKVLFNMIEIIIQFSPYGAFALTSWAVATQGLDILLSLSKLVAAITIAMIFQYFTFGLLIIIFCKVSPLPFYKKSLEYQLIAFSTTSSKATLPTATKVCKEKLGISHASASFVLPLGASINMDGFAIKLSLTTVFFAQMLDVTLAWNDYLVIILMSTLGSIGGAGIVGAFLIMLPLVLSSVNLPIEGTAILAGISRILDMMTTTINITGDTAITMIIDNSEKQFDKEKYYSKDNE